MNWQSKRSSFTPPMTEWAPSLNLAECEFRRTALKIEERLIHHCDRPAIEMQILRFISRAVGPSSQGIAKEMGISVPAAEVHLRELQRAKRIWGQAGAAGAVSWHATNEGRHYLAERKDSAYL